MSERASVNAPDMSAYVRVWMPFAANRQFKRAPRLLASAQGMYYTSDDGRRILDGTAGLWFHDSIVNGAPGGIELFHGRTDTAIAAAAACATIALYEREQLFERAARMASIFENAIHKLRGERHVIDVRNLGMVGGNWRRVPERLVRVLMMCLCGVLRRAC
jgi:beta-alanine--pyruvate transaminase